MSLHATPPDMSALLVGEADDAVLDRVQREFDRRHEGALRLDHEAFARHAAVSADGSGPAVSPDLPVLLRHRRSGPLEQAEHVWSACALRSSRVINRPTLELPVQPTPRELMDLLRTGAPVEPGLLLDEWYTDGSSPDPVHFEYERLVERGRVVPDSDDGAARPDPLRCRPRIPAGWFYQKALVVGDRCWLYNDTLRHRDDIWGHSLEIAAALGLDFCCLYWRTAGGPATLRLAKVTADPTAGELADLADIAASALVDELLG